MQSLYSKPNGRSARNLGMTLKFSLPSSSAADIESREGVRRGDRVWQIAFGSGNF